MPYGRIIPNLTIDGLPAPYGVVNERAVRATAGLMLLVGTTTLFWTLLTGDRLAVQIIVPLFWLEFALKIASPSWSLFGVVGEWIVRHQRPEWAGAIQKRFAWSLGLGLASAMLIVTFGFNLRGPIPLGICLTCLSFMWLESACGICVGCKIYQTLVQHGILRKPVVAPACPGGACAIPRPSQISSDMAT
jgi:Domain of unknown function (DUF4395)